VKPDEYKNSMRNKTLIMLFELPSLRTRISFEAGMNLLGGHAIFYSIEGGNFTTVPKDSKYYVRGYISHVYRRLDRKEPSYTIIAAGGGGTWGYHYEEPRPLTNRERARLQTFPDDFVFEGNISQVRRQIGNAVPPEGIRPFARAIKSILSGKLRVSQTQLAKFS